MHLRQRLTVDNTNEIMLGSRDNKFVDNIIKELCEEEESRNTDRRTLLKDPVCFSVRAEYIF